MAITSNRVCGVCGAPIGMLTAIYAAPEMRDDSYLCGDCLRRCSPNLSYSAIRSWTKEDAVAHINFMQQQADAIRDIFVETENVSANGEKLLCVDAQHGWWYAPSAAPDIFKLDQVAGWNLHMEMNIGDSAEFHTKFRAPRPDMPVPGRTDELEKLHLNIRICNHPYVDEISITMPYSWGLLEGYQSFLRKCYDTADLLYTCLERYCSSATGQIVFY